MLYVLHINLCICKKKGEREDIPSAALVIRCRPFIAHVICLPDMPVEKSIAQNVKAMKQPRKKISKCIGHPYRERIDFYDKINQKKASILCTLPFNH